ncbi:two-pore potassium channel 3 isoform X2 [Amborella trichopoda]|uniref:Potassium channel domain-containing protein n=1 Tax=Amborella trichopoda TaxID=13333 RepID=W1NGJ1_AMBTC|nr:two-pore potassium channel 3 isoform X2 [Amborella trichopoda]ERM94596.1 hypothetical protein AMTR_s00011p00085990 [Amborella trichopoda]|eukprot:XP_020523698.1 two-pore potassium channel 3 isoform X2 [Amborella trichopoda]
MEDSSPYVCLLSPKTRGSDIPSPLFPLPEHSEITPPLTSPSSSLKHKLIFGTRPSPSSGTPCLPHNHRLHRSQTAPAIVLIHDPTSHPLSKPQTSSQSVVRQAFVLLILYLSLGTIIYALNRNNFSGHETHPAIDALYFCIVTMCTIGYGDITPSSTASKIFSILFVLIGFGFIDIFLSTMVSHVLDLQESMLLATAQAPNYLVDVKKGRMRIRTKVGLALGVVVLCVGIGIGVLRLVEGLGWIDALYLSIMSVTTVGYGDGTFKSLSGRAFASIWLLVSTLAVARAFLYLAEARVDRRHSHMARRILARDMTAEDLIVADIDHNGFVSKSEYVIYKLKEMGKVDEKDIVQICNQFDRMDVGQFGKITLSDLMEAQH